MKNVKKPTFDLLSTDSESDSDLKTPLVRQRLYSDLPVEFWRKLAYSFGGLPKTCNLYVISVYFTLFLLEVAEIPPGLISIVLFVGKLLNAFSDPILGYLISRTPPTSCMGKTRPWILCGAPVALVSYFALWQVLPDRPLTVKVAYYTFMYWLYTASLMAYYIPFVSSVIGFTNNQRERDTLVAWRMTMESIGAIIGLAIHALLLFARTIKGWEMATVYTFSPMILDLIFLFSAIIVFISIDERYALVTNKSDIFLYYQEVIGFKPFQILALGFFFANMGYAVVTGIYALFFQYVFEKIEIFPLCMVIIFLSGALSVPIWQLVLKKFGKKTTFTIGLLGMMLLYWMHLYLSWVLPLMICLAVFGGLCVGCVMLLPQSMFPDVIAAFSIKHGTGREPMFFTITAFLDTTGQAVSLASTTLILQFVGYESGAPASEQPDSVALALRLIVGCFPVICGLCAIILIWQYPINETTRENMHEKIKKSMSQVSKHGEPIYS